MKKNSSICILCIGIFVLCLELYMVKSIQTMEKLSDEYYTNVWRYFEEPIILIPFIATILVIICSICSIVGSVINHSD